MSVQIIELPWLAEAPDEFRSQVRQLRDLKSGGRISAQRLAGYRLNGPQLHRLGEAVQALNARGHDSTEPVVKLGVISNGTTDILLPAFCASSIRYGIWVQPVSGAFGQVAQEAFDPNSAINRACCDFVLIATDHRGLPLLPSAGEMQRARETLEGALSHVRKVCNAIREASGATVIVQTLPQLPSSQFGSLERSIPGTPAWLIDAYNRELRTWLTGSGHLLLDVAALAEIVGLDPWHDPVHWAHGRFLFSHRCLPLYADWLARVIGAARGKSRKCLVLDLDNTIWGGEIGDDGLKGIVLGNGNLVGEAFLDVQRAALALRERGIVLAVSSKNDESVARSAFKLHPDMLLKEEHIAIFRANWQDKASNLKAIAQILNIGTDALVLLDDSPAERELVRQALPEVAVPELPADPAFYARTLLAAGYFESVGFTAEDRSRAAWYEASAKRAAAPVEGTDLGTYLRSLEMEAVFSRFDSIGRARITQLINKTNQFNLTTRRYTEGQIQELERQCAGFTLQVRLIDKFGDNGTIAAVICAPINTEWHIDTWLMSCRVLNREVERAMLNHIVESSRVNNIKTIVGHFRPSGRNDMVKEHYARLGFKLMEDCDGDTTWHLDVATYKAASVPMKTSIRLPGDAG